MTTTETSAVTTAALARLHDYFRRMQAIPAGEADWTLEAAYVEGFRSGGAWAIRMSSQLADPRFRDAIAVLAELLVHE